MSATQIQRLLNDEDGAVTVDWVVLTAAVIGLAFIVVLAVVLGATERAGSVAAYLSNSEINEINF